MAIKLILLSLTLIFNIGFSSSMYIPVLDEGLEDEEQILDPDLTNVVDLFVCDSIDCATREWKFLQCGYSKASCKEASFEEGFREYKADSSQVRCRDMYACYGR